MKSVEVAFVHCKVRRHFAAIYRLLMILVHFRSVVFSLFEEINSRNAANSAKPINQETEREREREKENRRRTTVEPCRMAIGIFSFHFTCHNVLCLC